MTTLDQLKLQAPDLVRRMIYLGLARRAPEVESPTHRKYYDYKPTAQRRPDKTHQASMGGCVEGRRRHAFLAGLCKHCGKERP